MTNSKIFNRGLAANNAFCNRKEELERLVKNIATITHTLLISPRRYGKTSLALRAIETTGLPCAHIDLFMKYEAEAVANEFFAGLSVLISRIIKPTELAVRKLGAFLKNLTVSLKLGELGFEFSLAPKTPDSRKDLKTLLMNVDELLAKNKKKAIVFVDEIQTIIGLEINDEVEAALRFVAQKTQNISFIFSGSSRHLLSKIFDDRSRPLYKLCHTMPVHRIAAEHYKSFINKFAKTKWQSFLPDEILAEIFFYTKLHSYYLNVLCAYLFELPTLPTVENVITCWEKVCQEEQSSVAKDIEFLTAKQKHLLSEIARHPGLREPTAHSFVKEVSLTPKGVLGALEILLKHDLIERLENGEIRIVDPVLERWIK